MGRTKKERKIKDEYTDDDEEDEGMMTANLDLLDEGEDKTKPHTATLKPGVVRFTKVKGSKAPTTHTTDKRRTATLYQMQQSIDKELKLPIVENARPDDDEDLEKASEPPKEETATPTPTPTTMKVLSPMTWKDFDEAYSELYDNGYSVNSTLTGDTPEDAIEKAKSCYKSVRFIQTIQIPQGEQPKRFSYMKGSQGKYIAFFSCSDGPKKETTTTATTPVEPPAKDKPTPPEPKPERPHYESDDKVTWTRLKPDGAWGIRVPNTFNVKEGSHVEVHRKDGTTSEQVLGVVVYKNDEVKLYSLKTNGVNA